MHSESARERRIALYKIDQQLLLNAICRGKVSNVVLECTAEPKLKGCPQDHENIILSNRKKPRVLVQNQQTRELVGA